MKIRVFQYPVPVAGPLDDLNVHLAAHPSAIVSQYLAAVPGGSCLVFVVSTPGVPMAARQGSDQEVRVDYRETLSPEEYEIFDRLRVERRKWATDAKVPVYNVFTNAQLAAIVQQRVRTVEELAALPGMGKARLDQYAGRILEILGAAPSPPEAERPGPGK